MKNVLKQKTLLSRVYNFVAKQLLQPDNYLLFVFIIVGILLLLKVVGSSAVTTVLFFIFVGIVLNLKIKDWATSYLMVTIYTMQFYAPNKYYNVIVFNPSDLVLGLGRYLLSYGVNLQNIFLLITLIFIARNLLIGRWHVDTKMIKKILFILIPGVVYFFISIYSLSRFSPYPNLSMVWLIQYMSMFVFAIIVGIFYKNKRGSLTLIFPLILSCIYFQSFIALIQFMKQSWIGLPVESYKAGVAYYGASDAVNGFFRVVGTYGHPNQFALILCLMLSLIIPNMFMAKWSKYVVGLIVSIPIIILSQSRSGWISLFSVVILTLFMYKAKILKIINKIGAIRFYLVMILTILGTSVVLFPRLIASYNAFSQSAGATLRIEMQKEALSAIKINPLAGHGIGTNEPILLSLFPNGYVYTFPAPIHMFYLQMALESGLVGLFAFLFPFLYILRCIINMYTQHSQKITLATKNNVFVFLAGFCAFGTYYLFQPHQGYIEFPLIGIILGFGTLFIYNLDYK